MSEARQLLRVATYNIHGGRGIDGRRDIARIARVIEELDCDVVGLQEVESRPGPSKDSMQLEFLADTLGMHCVSGPTFYYEGGYFGNAVLSRYQVTRLHHHDLCFPGREPRGALEVLVENGAEQARVIVAHLGLRPAERRHQVNALLQHLPRHSAIPVVLVGDINEWLPVGRPLRWLDQSLGRCAHRSTFPVWMPCFALDKIWVCPPYEIDRLEVHRSTLARVASDHFPLRGVVVPAGVRASMPTSAPSTP